MYETAVVSATEKCSLGAKIRKMSLQAYDSCAGRMGGSALLLQSAAGEGVAGSLTAIQPQ